MNARRQSPAARAVALDIGGVCLHLRPTRAANLLGYDSMERLVAENPAMLDYTRELETGRIEEDAYLRVMSETIFAQFSPDEIKRAWFELLGEEIPGMGDFVAALKREGYRPVFLSDISPFHHRCVLARLSFAELVESAVVSYQVGAMKPDAAMYRAFEAHCGGQRPALFLDDKACNVASARVRGWNACHFTGVDSAWQALAALRLCSNFTTTQESLS